MTSRFFVLGLLVGICSVTLASDPSPLKDFCVADSTSSDSVVHVNGKVCKDSNLVEAEDFFFSGLHIEGNTSTPSGNIGTKAIIPGLNTLGISMARGDFTPSGFSSHVHPRASEMVLVLKGRLEVGFVTSNLENRLITKFLQVGDVFVFPQGLVHFQRNARDTTLSAFSSQNSELSRVSIACFESNPAIPVDLLAKAFQVYEKTASQIGGI
ncbi:hypothetical protein RND71_020329 [Anisodus tanguticus]|uniref:Germin-like protein n=1 Tax=Anisodus tanguticus TaxID=243964 RepID=A0AAE1S184_9SOLA|nr:hypothetical protein RND71_020329 [Anisodus tanguticus]